MVTKRIQLIVIVMAAATSMLLMMQQLAAAETRAVTLSKFWAESNASNTVKIEFSTSTELNTDHFVIKRSTVDTDNAATAVAWDTITVTFEGGPVTQIPSRGGFSPYDYEVFDEDPNLIPGQQYWYTVAEVENGDPTLRLNLEYKDFAIIGLAPEYLIQATVLNTTGLKIAGSTVTYTIEVENVGNADSGRHISFRPTVPDPVVDGWTTTLESAAGFVLARNETQIITVSVTSPLALFNTPYFTSVVRITNTGFPSSIGEAKPVSTVGPTIGLPYLLSSP